MIDWTRVRELREEIGADDFGEVVDLFLEEADEVIARLSAMPEEETGAALHFLKGMALNLGFADVARLCQQGEAGGAVPRDALIDSYQRSKVAFSAETDRKVA